MFIDTEKKSYNELGFQRFGFLGLFPAVLSAAARAAASRVSPPTGPGCGDLLLGALKIADLNAAIVHIQC